MTADPVVKRFDTEDGAIKKVIVIGLDGLDPGIVSRLLEAGQLPNLARLKEQGGFARVATTRPAQTPVAWSTFATGTNPGGHGIFDFLRRNPKNYLPDLALNRYEQKNAFLPPKAVNLRRGTPVWELLKAAGRGATVLRCPCTYPPDSIRGRMLSGMGVPDLRGGLGTATFYTTERRGQAPRERERRSAPAGRATACSPTHLIGPRNPKDGGDLRVEITLRVDRRGPAGHAPVRRNAPGAGDPPGRLERLAAGQVQARAAPIDPRDGAVPPRRAASRSWPCTPRRSTSTPTRPSSRSASRPSTPATSPSEIGLYYTTGMVEDHAGLNNERISEEAFLDQCEIAWREREAMMLHELESFDDGLFYCLFDTPDRIQHLFWRFREPDHPANRGVAPDAEFAAVIDDAYRRCDAIVGKALEFADDQTLFIALSDHGFNSFRRGVHLNTWLYDNGFLALQGRRPARRGRRRPAPPGRLGPDPGLCAGPRAGST